MNKLLGKEIFDRKESKEFDKAADIDSGNYKVFLKDLDIDRTLRIYQSLLKLSIQAVEAVSRGLHNEFSFFTDKMRPLMCYIADNNVKLSNFLDQSNPMTSKIMERDPKIKGSVQKLMSNLKTIQSVRESAKAITYNVGLLASRELTNAYIDYQLDLAWDYDHDLVVLINLNDMRLIDYFLERGQKRFVLAGGDIEADQCENVINVGGTLIKLPNLDLLKKQGGIPNLPGRPYHRYAIIDTGTTRVSNTEIRSVAVGLHHERNNQWSRFNTINRADTTRILNNLANMAIYDQTNVFHNKFKDNAAIIVSPGPSLEKNLKHLKKAKGKAIIICVLHALKDIQKIGIEPDVVVHVDPVDLKICMSKKDGKLISYWDQWITDNDLNKVECFVVSNYSKPDLFDIPTKNMMWMSSGLPVNELVPIDLFDYERVGGSVSHAAFDLAVEMGCSSIALIGQDLAFSKDGTEYSKHADLGQPGTEDTKIEEMRKVYGSQVEVKGWHGENILSNITFVSFAQAFEGFAKNLEEQNIRLFNCTEGGTYLEGFEHCKFIDFIEEEVGPNANTTVDLLKECKSASKDVTSRIKETRKFIVKNRILAKEIRGLIKILISIARKKFHENADLTKFDRLQNKMIKKMGKNKFYSLGLQRDIHILQAGLKADPSVEGQLGFHLDFLRVSQDLNDRFDKQFADQLHKLDEYILN